MENIVLTSALSKSFQGKEVVTNVNMRIRKGEIYGFLGPNGAGKTTIMKMMTNLVKPTQGRIEIFGESLKNNSYKVLKRMGSIIEYPFFYDRLTARKNLEIHCEYLDNKENRLIDDVLELVNLQDTGDKKVKDFSLGMKQRLGIARAVITKPELLILDEPINGLDPIGIREMRDLFKKLSREYGITILISSHILAEIEQIADTIGVISNGRLVKEVSMEQFREQNTAHILLLVDNPEEAIRVLRERLQIVDLKLNDDGRIQIFDQSVSVGAISKMLVLNGVTVEEINKQNHSLEDYFLSIINGGEAGV